MNKNLIKLLVVITITAFIMFILIRNINISLIIENLSNANLELILLGLAILALAPFANTMRWKEILEGLGYRISFGKLFNITMASMAFLIVPGRLGDFVKIYPLKNKVSKTDAAGSVIVEKIMDLFWLSLFGLLGSLISGRKEFIFIPIILIIGIFFGIFSVYFLKNRLIRILKKEQLRNILSNLYAALTKLSQNPKRLIFASLYSSINWITSLTTTYFLFSALGVNISFFTVAALMPITILVGLIPVTLTGIGTRDLAMIKLFSSYANVETILSVGLLYTFFAYWLFIIIGALFVKNIFPESIKDIEKTSS